MEVEDVCEAYSSLPDTLIFKAFHARRMEIQLK